MWFVWNRCSLTKSGASGWCDAPKQYKTKRAAHMAVGDLNAYYDFRSEKYKNLGRIEHIALPAGMKPRHDMVIRYI